jgi:hypothetical protein
VSGLLLAVLIVGGLIPRLATGLVASLPTDAFIPLVGGSTTVALSIDNILDVQGLDVVVTYDASIVEATDVDVVSITDNCSLTSNLVALGTIIIRLRCPEPGLDFDPPVVTIDFLGVAEGESPLHFAMCDILPDTLPCATMDGLIRVGILPTPTPTPTPNLTPSPTPFIGPGAFVILGSASNNMAAMVGRGSQVDGSVCVSFFDSRLLASIGGDVIATIANGQAVMLGRRDRIGTVEIAGSLVTGGGNIVGIEHAEAAGGIDTTGTAGQLGDCNSARADVAAWHQVISNLPPTLTIDRVFVGRRKSARIPAAGTLGAGQILIDTPKVRVRAGGRLVIAGSPQTDAVIVRVGNSFRAGHNAVIELEGLSPEQVIFVVKNSAIVKFGAVISGSLFAEGPLNVGQGATLNGQAVGESRIRLRRLAMLSRRPFCCW